MTYTSRTELPFEVRNTLPGLGQELYMGAFNDAESRGDGDPSRAAWAEVEKRYRQAPDGQWEMSSEHGNPGGGGGGGGRRPLEGSRPRGIKGREESGSSAEQTSPLDQRGAGHPSTDTPEGNRT